MMERSDAARPAGPSPDRYRIGIRVIAGIFLVRAVIMGLLVTPLWDVPDEVGHYAYVAAIAHGRFPVVGRSTIPAPVVANWRGVSSAPAVENWIAMHPPLYHAAAAPLLVAAEALHLPPAWCYRAPRLLSAVCGALTILLLFEGLVAATGENMFALSCAAAVAFLPMFNHMASGTSNDLAVACTGSAVAWGWARSTRAFTWRDAFLTGAALATASALKLTVVPIIPLILLSVFFSARRAGQWSWRYAAGAGVLALTPGLAWVAWLKIESGSMLLLATERAQRISPVAFFTSAPAIEHTVKNFFGLIGWTGTGHGELLWLQIGREFYAPFAITLVLMVLLSGAWYVQHAWRLLWRPAALGLCAAYLATLVFFVWRMESGSAASVLKATFYGCIVAGAVFTLLCVAWKKWSMEERVVCEALMISVLFAAAYLSRVWNAFAVAGAMRATHGRYFFVVLPFLALAVVYPSFLQLPARLRRTILLLPLTWLVADIHFLLRAVIPFYQTN